MWPDFQVFDAGTSAYGKDSFHRGHMELKDNLCLTSSENFLGLVSEAHHEATKVIICDILCPCSCLEILRVKLYMNTKSCRYKFTQTLANSSQTRPNARLVQLFLHLIFQI